jgi:hypothetical protein
MTEIISWLKEYSPPVVLLLAIGAAVLYVIRLAVEKSIAANFDARAKETELLLQTRSTFRDKVLTERFTLITNLSARLERVMTNLIRLRNGISVPDGFMVGNEVRPLTEIFEDISINRLTLTEEFHEIFLQKAKLALRAANAHSKSEWDEVIKHWESLDKQIREAVEKTFEISKIRM